ncbi:MAG: Fic family protein [Pseudarcicella sp.]|jgi:Fic family protein|nr:Fic family protein [Pseudarcicella sp.]
MKKLTDKYFSNYVSMLNVNIEKALELIKERNWTTDSFRFYTAVSVMSSARIEGETMEIDSYLKHKLQNIAYLPTLTEKPNDLFEAYEFASDNALTLEFFLESHRIATKHLLPENLSGAIRKGNILIMEQQTQQVQYKAALASVVTNEFESFWVELDELIQKKLNPKEIFYYASLIHLVFVKIHPFNDGNGRTGRLLEKWFIASKLGEKAWYIGSEHFYYKNLKDYYL